MDIYSPEGIGNIEMMLQLAEVFRQTDRMETVVPRYFFALCTMAADLSPNWKSIYRRPEISKAMIELSEARAKSTGYSPEAVSFLAVNAWPAGDFTVFAEAYEKVGRRLDRKAQAKLAAHNITNFEQELAVLSSPA